MVRSKLRAPLISRHRLRARLLLYLSPIVLGALGWGISAYFRDIGIRNDWARIDYRQDESVRIFQDYLRIDTSYPSGNEIAGAEFLARELARDGIPAHVERLGHRNANLWAILEGEDPRALVLHNHIDVDPVRHPDEWENPPFSGIVDLPFIYGRGAFDMKSLAVAQLMALKELVRDGTKLERSLVFLATGDEEREAWHGTRWILRHHPELVRRFDVVLTEGGAVEATDLDEVKYWGTEHLQKLFVEMRVCSSNRGALEALWQDLNVTDKERGRRAELPASIVDELEAYVATREFPDFLTRFEDALRGGGGFESLPPNVLAMMRHDLAAFPVEEDPEGGYSMRLVLQLLPWESIETGREALLPGGLPGFSVAVDVPHGPVELGRDEHPIFELIRRHVADVYPEFNHGPIFIPWAATDARFYRAAGIPAYGFSPFLILTGDAAKITGPNERIAAPPFIDGVELYVGLVRKWVE